MSERPHRAPFRRGPPSVFWTMDAPAALSGDIGDLMMSGEGDVTWIDRAALLAASIRETKPIEFGLIEVSPSPDPPLGKAPGPSR